MKNLQALTPEAILTSYKRLSTTEKLIFLWMTYQRTGQTIVPDAPNRPYSEMGHRFNQTFQQLSQAEQRQAMRDILEDCPTRLNVHYKGLSENCRLAFWFELAQSLDDRLRTPMIKAAQVSENTREALAGLESLDSDHQLNVLRSIFLS